MNRGLAFVVAFVLIWYVSFTFGCITAHHSDTVSVENPPSNEEVKESIMAVECLVPEPTTKGLVIAVLVTVSAAYLGVRT